MYILKLNSINWYYLLILMLAFISSTVCNETNQINSKKLINKRNQLDTEINNKGSLVVTNKTTTKTTTNSIGIKRSKDSSRKSCKLLFFSF
jgi:hypothetical protein